MAHCYVFIQRAQEVLAVNNDGIQFLLARFPAYTLISGTK